MAVQDRDYMRSRGPGLGLPGSWTWRLIIVCCAVLFLQKACRAWSGPPIDLWFGLSLSGLAHGRLWGVFTYAFLHAGFGHLFWNCFGIWVFGSMLERSMAPSDFGRLTVWAAIAGGVGYLVGDILMGTGGYVIGASGILSAYLALAALRFPNAPIRLMLFPFFAFPLWVLAVVFFAGDLLGAFSQATTGIAYWAHLGGAAYGATVFKLGVWPRFSLPRVRVGTPSGPSKPSAPSHEQQQRDADRRRVDDLLAKISREGIGSLSDEERRFLNEASKRYH